MARFIKVWIVVPDDPSSRAKKLVVPTRDGDREVTIAGWFNHPVFGRVAVPTPKAPKGAE